VTLPAALAGGVLMALATGAAASLAATVGLLAVLGIALRTGILLIDHCRQLLREGTEEFGPRLVLRAARERLAPTLTTTLATAAAMLPFAVLGDRAGLEMVHQISLVILGGLVTSTLLNLFIVPPLFLISGPSPEPEAAAIPIEQAAEPQVIGAG
jgi:Cu/Ag efflux pump CusA